MLYCTTQNTCEHAYIDVSYVRTLCRYDCFGYEFVPRGSINNKKKNWFFHKHRKWPCLLHVSEVHKVELGTQCLGVFKSCFRIGSWSYSDDAVFASTTIQLTIFRYTEVCWKMCHGSQRFIWKEPLNQDHRPGKTPVLSVNKPAINRKTPKHVLSSPNWRNELILIESIYTSAHDLIVSHMQNKSGIVSA